MMATLAGDQEKLAIFAQHDGFVFDLDGTVWRGTQLIPGAAEVISLLRQQGKRVFFVTNNANSRANVVKKLKKCGIQAFDEEVYTSAYAAAVTLSQAKNKHKKAYVIGEAGLVDELTLAGITVLGGPQDSDKAFDFTSDPSMSHLDPSVTAVVVGLDKQINYYKLQTAQAYIVVHKAQFIATNTDARGNLSSQDEWAGAGTMVAAVIGCSEAEPIVVGKPQTLIMDLLSKASGITRNRLMVVGDRLDTDIAWGKRCGTGTLLVLTGCTSEEQLIANTDASKRPDLYIKTIGDLLSVTTKLNSWDTCNVS
ncbi:HAD-like domain-containing protein [Haematococcus lacustris]